MRADDASLRRTSASVTSQDGQLLLLISDPDTTGDGVVIPTDALRDRVVPRRAIVSSALEHFATVGVRVERAVGDDVGIVPHDDLFADVVIDRHRSDDPTDLHGLTAVVQDELLAAPVVENDQCRLKVTGVRARSNEHAK